VRYPFGSSIAYDKDRRFCSPKQIQMSDSSNPISYIKEVGGVFKLGSGVLGKSAIAVGFLMVTGTVAVFRLKSDLAILTALGVTILVFLAWFFPVMRFVQKHPDTALLEGAEWTGYQRFQAEAKGYIPQSSDKQPIPAPGTSDLRVSDKSIDAKGQDT
jgi:hypothetical protein